MGNTHLQSQQEEGGQAGLHRDETIYFVSQNGMLREVSNGFSYMAMSCHLEALTFPSLVFKPHAPSSASIRGSQHIQDQGTLGPHKAHGFLQTFRK